MNAFFASTVVIWCIAGQAAGAAADTPTEAERIARLQRSIDANEKDLQAKQAELQNPQSNFQRADARFKELDAQRDALEKDIQRLKREGKMEEAARKFEENNALQERWKLARERFDLAIRERQLLQEKIAALQKRIDDDRKTLNQFLDGKTGDGTPPATAPAAPRPPNRRKNASSSAADKAAAPREATAVVAAEAPSPTGPLDDRLLQQAREEAQARQAVAREAEGRAEAVAKRLEALRKNIELEQKTADAARKRADLLQESRALLEKEVQKKADAHAAPKDIEELLQKIDRVKARQAEVQTELAASADRNNELQEELTALQTEQAAAQSEAQKKDREAEAARQKVADLENPFSLHQLRLWLFRHGPRILFILVGFFIVHRLVKLSSHKIVNLMSLSGQRGTHREREHRAHTLVGVFRNTASMVVVAGGFLMICDELGIPIVPLMGGAAVLGLAVAFGAQNLIRDYFSGFMVLLEDQYAIDDVVQIGTISGSVERITLRMTVLRDTEGVAHFIPHGTITTVSNMTHGWSRALFDIGVAYKEDVDRVMQVLLELGAELRRDDFFGPFILDDPEMLGVDRLDDSAVVLRFYMKTMPLKQWKVKREMLRRIKRTFDELKIEIPYPHRTVFHRYEDGIAGEQTPADRKVA